MNMQPIPPNPESALPASDVVTCIRVLRAIEADRSLLTRLTQQERRELLTFAGLVAKPEKHALVKMAKAFRRAERETAQEQDRKAIEQTALRIQRHAPVYAPLWIAPPEADAPDDRPELNRELSCYVCKQPFVKLHRYYDSLCEACGDFNYSKRTQTADLSGHHALVTGARVKIGFNASLKLLRAGANVIVTTRFPVDCAERYAQEADFQSFRDRLQIHGLDLRHTPSVELFARFLVERLPRLDYILNNACQTVRRPPGFFQHLIIREEQAFAGLPDPLRHVLTNHNELIQAIQGNPGHREQQLVTAAHLAPGDGLLHSAALSQRHYMDEDIRESADLFPVDRYDEDRQQVDLREINSWRLRMHEVATAELLEVQLVNAVAPYILNARLKPLMLRTPGRHKHIVNVSAMEGQFYRSTKTDKHPHTNMAKAALNMMTRTSAADFVKDGIHMNAVDTGWVTDEDPAVHAARKAELGFAPPLDIIDGAARIVDPIFVGQLTGTHVWGQFLKDYKPAPW
jgi:NAD(P)-dependent dehydrogenase (short-subunit alcohol dehydrogenase family)